MSEQSSAGTDWPSGLFVKTDWLENNLQRDNLRIVQVGGENFYNRLHIPGAVMVGYNEITGYRDGVPGFRSESALLSKLFGKLGIGPDTQVVAYDASGGMDAARFIWTMHCMGHSQGYVLDGGMGAWYTEQRITDHQLPQIAPVEFAGVENLSWDADIDLMQQVAAGDVEMKVLDTRSEAEYEGQTIRGPRGHIPGAYHLEWTDALRGPQDPHLKEDAQLQAMLSKCGVDNPAQDEVVVYCQTAHRAAHTWAMLRHLGYGKVRLYDGSMAEWGLAGQAVVAGKSPR
ncbi:sulfurtransferase [Magnetococcus sp. PR-3]|uniref:sulfurtransferase n=1 Tax=Magnetococcus sp. PR-3 TaxID=3120355 RepID=UPI002FCE5E40